MARPTKHPNFIAKGKDGYRVTRGKKLMADGVSSIPEAFILGFDYEEAKTKKQIIEAEFAILKRSGTVVWTEQAYARLHAQGAISDKKLTNSISVSEAIKLYDEPLTNAELAPFTDPATGMVKPECAIQAADLDARKVFTHNEIRSKFHQRLLAAASNDPIATLERMSKLFNWSGKEAQSFMFNVQGNVQMAEPIAFDASAQRRLKREELKNIEGAVGNDTEIPNTNTGSE